MSSRSKRGRRRNRGRFSLLFKLLAGAALVAALTFGATVFFQVEHILIAGNSRYTAQEVEEASGILPPDGMPDAEREKGCPHDKAGDHLKKKSGHPGRWPSVPQRQEMRHVFQTS